MLIEPAQSLLLIVNVQDRLVRAMHQSEATIRNNRILLAGAAHLRVPVILTEQYVRGLGKTVSNLFPLPPGTQRIEKMHFSCTREPGFSERLALSGRRQIIVTGMETHVCVLQTVLGLRSPAYADYTVFVVADATTSRTPENRAFALERMRDGGAHIVTSEMVIFEWLQKAGTKEFHALLPFIK